MQRLIFAVILSFAIALVLGPIVIPWLKRMKFGQNVYNLGPESHKVKQGVPTMGGIIFAVPMVIVPVALSFEDARWDFLPIAVLSMLLFAMIGFVDDFIKIKMKRNLGLTPMQKILPQVILSLALSVWAYNSPNVGSKLIVPFTSIEWDLGLWYIPVMSFILVGTVNSANLLDGLDGLLAGCSLIDFITMALITMSMAVRLMLSGQPSGNTQNLMIFCGAAAGALLGFLRYNSHPAGVIMGDVGSFAIGGALVAVMMMTRLALLLPLIAMGMLASTVSDIIQIGYFKLTHGKRVFKMAPLHHHFELSGMQETKIVSMYMIATALLCLIALLPYVEFVS